MKYTYQLVTNRRELPDDVVAEVSVNQVDDVGKFEAEFFFHWRDLGGKEPAAQVVAYDDGWAALFNQVTLCQALAFLDTNSGGRSIQPQELCSMLAGLGYEEVKPKEPPQPPDKLGKLVDELWNIWNQDMGHERTTEELRKKLKPYTR